MADKKELEKQLKQALQQQEQSQQALGQLEQALQQSQQNSEHALMQVKAKAYDDISELQTMLKNQGQLLSAISQKLGVTSQDPNELLSVIDSLKG